jgi:glutamate/tyrosine decarboxylase-like PLP-dependent enzyme
MNKLNFSNPNISTITLDAHKMCQAPHGTGIFLAKKGMLKLKGTSASYVKGNDFTLVGIPSGANASTIWMILSTHGTYRWIEKTFIL